MPEVPSPIPQESMRQATVDVDYFGPDSSVDLDSDITRNGNEDRDYWKRIREEQLAASSSIAAEVNRDLVGELGLNKPEVSFDINPAKAVDDLDFPDEPVRPARFMPEETQPLSNLAYDRERDTVADTPIRAERPQILEPNFDYSLYGTEDDTEEPTESFIDLRDPFDTDLDSYYTQADEETRRQLEELEVQRRRHDIEIAAAAAALVVADELDLLPIDF